MSDNRYKPLSRSLRPLAIAIAGLLLIPLVAMQFSEEVLWTVTDFVVAAALLFGAGFAFIWLTRKSRSPARRMFTGLAVVLVFAYIWAELAVGVFTTLGS